MKVRTVDDMSTPEEVARTRVQKYEKEIAALTGDQQKKDKWDQHIRFHEEAARLCRKNLAEQLEKEKTYKKPPKPRPRIIPPVPAPKPDNGPEMG